MDKLLFYIYIS